MEYIDFLLVEKMDGSVAMAIAEICKAEVGCVVSFNGGELGHVVVKACTKKGSNVDNLISAVVPVYEADAIYPLGWKRKAVQNADDPGSP